MSSHGALFILGSGPGIGSHVARHFATSSFTHIALFARSPDKLTKDASFITTSAPSTTVHIYPVDIADHSALRSTLEKAVTATGAPEVVIFNAARIRYSKFSDGGAEEDMIQDFRVSSIGLYTTARVLLPHLRNLAESNPAVHPAMFITSGGIARDPTHMPALLSLGMAKAAQANLAKLLADENKGLVHVALVMVNGRVDPEAPAFNPRNIAGTFWKLYQQERGKWQFEMEVTGGGVDGVDGE